MRINANIWEKAKETQEIYQYLYNNAQIILNDIQNEHFHVVSKYLRMFIVQWIIITCINTILRIQSVEKSTVNFVF